MVYYYEHDKLLIYFVSAENAMMLIFLGNFFRVISQWTENLGIFPMDKVINQTYVFRLIYFGLLYSKLN